MERDAHNIIPMSLALLLHVILFGSLFFAFDFSRKVQPAMPLAIKATLMTDGTVVLPPPREEIPEPAVVPEPEPEVVEPDPAEEQRVEAERVKREEDARVEREQVQRIEEEKQAQEKLEQEELEQEKAEEQKRVAEAEAKAKAEEEAKQKEDEAKRKREEEVRLERERADAERQREEDIERQRQENERQRREAEDVARSEELDAEDRLLTAQNSNEMAAYIFAIQQKVRRVWVQPASATADLECVVRVRQLPSGDVVGVNVLNCNGDGAVVRSIEAAVKKASPLPQPSNPILFEPDLRFVFKPEQ